MYVLDLHRGKVPWPEELSLRSGWMRRTEEAARRHGQPRYGSSRRGPREVLGLVAEVCGVGRRSLPEVAYGRSANAPRRFAVWALRESTALRQVEIAKVLSMSLRQVESVLWRIDLDTEPMESWAAAFEERILTLGESA